MVAGEDEAVVKLGTPSAHLDAALAVTVQVDDQLHGLRTQVLTGGEVGLFEPRDDLEGLYDLLSVRIPFICGDVWVCKTCCRPEEHQSTSSGPLQGVLVRTGLGRLL